MGRGATSCLLAGLAVAASCGGGGPQSSPGFVGSVSRGRVNLQIDGGAAGTNLSPSHIPANEVTVVFHDTSMGLVALYVAGFEHEGGDSYKKQWDLSIALVGEPVAGDVYQIGSVFMMDVPGTATVNIQDPSSWGATGGTITVTSLANATATFTFAGVTMAPTSSTSTGTFTLSGTLTIDNIYDVCDCFG